MKNVQKLVLSVALVAVTLFASGQSNTDVKQILSKQETRKLIMDTIANDSIMAKEMMTTMMNSKNHKMMMMRNHGSMMMDNHGMKRGMMANSMKACKGDTSMMFKCKAMMGACKGDTAMMAKCKAMMGACKGDTAMMAKCKAMMGACKGDTAMMAKCKAMMGACKGDTAMMSSKCKTMMEDPQMKEMTQKRMNENKDVKNIETVDKTKLKKMNQEK